jgi:hypothetical protein
MAARQRLHTVCLFICLHSSCPAPNICMTGRPPVFYLRTILPVLLPDYLAVRYPVFLSVNQLAVLKNTQLFGSRTTFLFMTAIRSVFLQKSSVKLVACLFICLPFCLSYCPSIRRPAIINVCIFPSSTS